MTSPPDLWDTEGVAAHLKMSSRYVQQLVREGRIPFIRFGRTLRFHPDEIDAWLRARTARAVR